MQVVWFRVSQLRKRVLFKQQVTSPHIIKYHAKKRYEGLEI